MAVRVHDTLQNATVELAPRDPGRITMYVCGPTVYDVPHVGHGRTAVVYDVIRRYLEWSGYKVHHAQNFTDVDDKIINRARQLGISEEELTNRLIEDWAEETRALNIMPATVYPRATQEIPEIIAMIEGLIRLEHAYPVEGGDVDVEELGVDRPGGERGEPEHPGGDRSREVGELGEGQFRT